jgi:hypothetical protein
MNPGSSFTAEDIAKAVNAEKNAETVFKILEHASANADHRIIKTPGTRAVESKYSASGL